MTTTTKTTDAQQVVSAKEDLTKNQPNTDLVTPKLSHSQARKELADPSPKGAVQKLRAGIDRAITDFHNNPENKHLLPKDREQKIDRTIFDAILLSTKEISQAPTNEIQSLLSGLNSSLQARIILAAHLPDYYEHVIRLARKFEPFPAAGAKNDRVDARNDFTNSKILKDIYSQEENRFIPAVAYAYTAALLQGFRAWTGYGKDRSEFTLSNLALSLNQLCAGLKLNANGAIATLLRENSENDLKSSFKVLERRVENGSSITIVSGGGKHFDELSELKKRIEKAGLAKIRFTDPIEGKVVTAEEFVKAALEEIRNQGNSSNRRFRQLGHSSRANVTLISPARNDEASILDKIIDSRFRNADNPYSEHMTLSNGEIIRAKDLKLRDILHDLARLARHEERKHSR